MCTQRQKNYTQKIKELAPAGFMPLRIASNELGEDSAALNTYICTLRKKYGGRFNVCAHKVADSESGREFWVISSKFVTAIAAHRKTGAALLESLDGAAFMQMNCPDEVETPIPILENVPVIEAAPVVEVPEPPSVPLESKISSITHMTLKARTSNGLVFQTSAENTEDLVDNIDNIDEALALLGKRFGVVTVKVVHDILATLWEQHGFQGITEIEESVEEKGE
jgi:hypothetical protein